MRHPLAQEENSQITEAEEEEDQETEIDATSGHNKVEVEVEAPTTETEEIVVSMETRSSVENRIGTHKVDQVASGEITTGTTMETKEVKVNSTIRKTEIEYLFKQDGEIISGINLSNTADLIQKVQATPTNNGWLIIK